MTELLGEIDSFKDELINTSELQLKQMNDKESCAKHEIMSLKHEMKTMADCQYKYKQTLSELQEEVNLQRNMNEKLKQKLRRLKPVSDITNCSSNDTSAHFGQENHRNRIDELVKDYQNENVVFKEKVGRLQKKLAMSGEFKGSKKQKKFEKTQYYDPNNFDDETDRGSTYL